MVRSAAIRKLETNGKVQKKYYIVPFIRNEKGNRIQIEFKCKLHRRGI